MKVDYEKIRIDNLRHYQILDNLPNIIKLLKNRQELFKHSYSKNTMILYLEEVENKIKKQLLLN